MFTGIIEHLGTVAAHHHTEEGSQLTVTVTPQLASQLFLGASIAVDGVCTTVVEKTETTFSVVASPETLRCTIMGQYRPGTPVHLELPVTLQTPLGGHYVTGHVDTVATVDGIQPEGVSFIFRFNWLDPQWRRFVVEKGSIAVNGISLTVNQVTPEGFTVAIIPHTWEQTTLKSAQVGDRVNVETDLIGKYMVRLAEPYLAALK